MREQQPYCFSLLDESQADFSGSFIPQNSSTAHCPLTHAIRQQKEKEKKASFEHHAVNEAITEMSAYGEENETLSLCCSPGPVLDPQALLLHTDDK